MERKLIMCPGTEQLEVVEMERTPLGIVIGSCSRFAPTCALTCGGECAARMDREDRLVSPELRARVLVLYAGDSYRLAVQLASLLGADHLVAELADTDTQGAPPPQDYDAVVVVAAMHRRRLARSMVDYITAHHYEMTGLPSFFVPISTRSDDDVPAGEAASTVFGGTGWDPRYSEPIAVHERTSANVYQRIRALATKIADETPLPDSTD